MPTGCSAAKSIPKRVTISPHLKRVGWFIALWCGGVAVVAVIGLIIKLMLRA
jgi:hypothetical protein